MIVLAFLFAALCVTVFFLFGAIHDSSRNDPLVSVKGIDTNGNYLNGAGVTVNGDVCIVNGDFCSFADLRPGRHVVKVTADGYNSVNTLWTVGDSVNNQINIVLGLKDSGCLVQRDSFFMNPGETWDSVGIWYRCNGSGGTEAIPLADLTVNATGDSVAIDRKDTEGTLFLAATAPGETVLEYCDKKIGECLKATIVVVK